MSFRPGSLGRGSWRRSRPPRLRDSAHVVTIGPPRGYGPRSSVTSVSASTMTARSALPLMRWRSDGPYRCRTAKLSCPRRRQRLQHLSGQLRHLGRSCGRPWTSARLAACRWCQSAVRVQTSIAFPPAALVTHNRIGDFHCSRPASPASSSLAIRLVRAMLSLARRR